MAADSQRSQLSRPALHALQLLGAVWTLPNTLLGLLAGLAGCVAGARPRWQRRELALVFERWPWGPGGAMTLGNVILLNGHSLDTACHTYAHRAGHCEHPAVRLGDHERAHVYQYLLLWLLIPNEAD